MGSPRLAADAARRGRALRDGTAGRRRRGSSRRRRDRGAAPRRRRRRRARRDRRRPVRPRRCQELHAWPSANTRDSPRSWPQRTRFERASGRRGRSSPNTVADRRGRHRADRGATGDSPRSCLGGAWLMRAPAVDRGQQRARLDPRLLDLALGVRAPDDAAADPEMPRPSAIANVRIVSARSKSPSGRSTPSAPIDAPRPTGSSAAIRSTRCDLRRARDRPARERRTEDRTQRDAVAKPPLDRRHQVRDAGQLALLHQLAASGSSPARRRGRGRSARGRRSSRARRRPSGRRRPRPPGACP